MPPTQPQNSPEDGLQGKHHNKPLFYVALLICLTILCFALWYGYDRQSQDLRDEETAKLVVTAPADSTSDWKTYRNEEYGFEFKYPNRMTLVRDGSDEYFINSANPRDADRPLPIFWEIKETKFKNIEEWFISTYKHREDLMPTRTSIKLDGYDAYNIDDPVSIGAPITGIVWIKDGVLYDFTFSLNGAEFVDQILSTFKFISTSTAVLPPDPGEAGKKTLAGIDSDNDGVRDDIQIYIAKTYPDSAKARAALTQMARSAQSILLEANDATSTKSNFQSAINGSTCLGYLIGVRESLDALKRFLAEFMNTQARINAYAQANRLESGTITDVPGLEATRRATCDFDLDSLPN